MGKLVVLKLDGDLTQNGFKVTLEIGEEAVTDGSRVLLRPSVEEVGTLPANTDLAAALQEHWLDKYRNIGAPTRIKPQAIEYGSTLEERLHACRESAHMLQARLSDWLDCNTFRPIDKRLREELQRDEPARFLIRTDDLQVQKLPWHLWELIDCYAKAEPAFSGTKLARSRHPSLLPHNPKVKILAILGHSQGINVEADRDLLNHLPHAEVTLLAEPNHQELNDQLRTQAWDIIFFAGHSETEEETGKIYINSSDSLTLDELWYALRKAVDRGLKLAIFNSCDGLGLTKRLDDLEIPQMIVMRELVPDRVAQAFLKYFLTAFAGGMPFHLAVRDARESLQGLESHFPCASWLPVICQNPGAEPLTWQEMHAQSQLLPLSASRRIRRPTGLAVLALLLMVIAFSLWECDAKSRLARYYNNRAFEHYQRGEMSEFHQALDMVLKIDPQFDTTLYMQGLNCEEARDFNCAFAKYRAAAKLGLAAAYSKLARLEILQNNDPAAAVDFLLEGIELDDPNIPVQSSLLTNLGWARLEQNRLSEAKQALQDAIDIDPERGATRCLMAQVLEQEGNQQNALAEWQFCQQYADPKNPEDDAWIEQARQRLQPGN